MSPLDAVSALSLGSNLGDRLFFLNEAVSLFDLFGCKPSPLSKIYETEPVECGAQPLYLNRVVIIEDPPKPRELLALCRIVEKQLGRRRRAFHAARTIDVDLLFSGSLVMNTAELILPHPALSHRLSILVPLAELIPGWRHPLLGRSVEELLAAFSDHGRVEPFRKDSPPKGASYCPP